MSEEIVKSEDLKRCLNCKQVLYPNALYCAYCGQKDSDGRITVKHFVSEIMESVFNIDSRFFKTLRHIFVPARLTKEYFQGRHKKYAHPLRVFFIIAVVHLSIIAIVTLSNIGDMGDTPLNQIREQQSGTEVYMSIETFYEERESENADQQSLETLDSLLNYIKNNSRIKLDSTSHMTIAGFDSDSMKLKQYNIRFIDMATLPLDSLYEKYEARDFLSRIMIQQSIKVNEEPKAMFRFAIGNLVWMLFILMPALAGLMKLLYIRRNFFFVEHLVFLYHWHAFAFVVMSVYLILANVIPQAFIPFVFMIIVGFGFIALKRYYQQGVFKSIVKFFILLSFYLFLLIALVVLTILISLLVF